MVDLPGSGEGLSVPGSTEGDRYHGCKSDRLGSSSPFPSGSRTLVTGGAGKRHKLARTEGHPPGSSPVPDKGGGASRKDPDGQRDGKSTRKSGRRNAIAATDGRDYPTLRMGGTAHGVTVGRSHRGRRQRAGGLAEQTTPGPVGVDVTSVHISRPFEPVRPSGPGPLRPSEQRASAQVLLPLPVPLGRECRRPSFSMASGSAVRISSLAPDSQSNTESAARTGGRSSGRALLASEDLVCGLDEPLGRATLEDSGPQDRIVSGGHTASRTPMAAADRLALERIRMTNDNLSRGVISIIQASRRPSTTRIYNATWRTFCSWCATRHTDPTSASVPEVLDFLHSGFDKGLAASTLRRHVAALDTVLSNNSDTSLSRHPRIRGFLRGVSNLRPPVIHRYPTWDLQLVLQALTSEPFEPLASVSLRLLTLKVAFLVAVTSARRISELAALSVRSDLCVFHRDRVVLRLDPSFLPKVNTPFHRATELVLPDFCPNPTHQSEISWHTLDVRRALRRYIKRTASFRRSEALFVSFLPASLGQKVSSTTIGRWLRACIFKAYSSSGKPPPGRVLPHSTRSASTSAAWATQASVLEICRAATWSTLSPFIKHYKIDSFASAEASFGRRVLQSVVPSTA